jgi:hypothetical protein
MAGQYLIHCSFGIGPGDDDQYCNYLTGPYLIQSSFSTGPGDDQYSNYLAGPYLIQGSISTGTGDHDNQYHNYDGALILHNLLILGPLKI